MNYQPAEDRIREIEEQQKELKKRIENLERHTEPIKIARLEIDQGNIQEQLASLNKQFDSIQEDVAVLKVEMQGARADIISIRASQSDFGEYLEEDRQTQAMHTDMLERHAESVGDLINFAESHDAKLENMATKDDIARIEGVQSEHGKHFDHIEATMATKQDLQAMEQRIQDTLIKFLRPPKQ